MIGASLVACGQSEEALGTPTAEARTGTATPASPTSTATNPPEDVAAVFRRFVDALNKGSAGDAEALLATGATWERGAQCAPGLCVGLTRLRQEIDRDVANHHRLDIVALDTSGNTVTARVELRTDRTCSAEIQRIIQVFTVTVANGKIASLRAVNDVTDALTASFTSQRGGGQ